MIFELMLFSRHNCYGVNWNYICTPPPSFADDLEISGITEPDMYIENSGSHVQIIQVKV